MCTSCLQFDTSVSRLERARTPVDDDVFVAALRRLQSGEGAAAENAQRQSQQKLDGRARQRGRPQLAAVQPALPAAGEPLHSLQRVRMHRLPADVAPRIDRYFPTNGLSP